MPEDEMQEIRDLLDEHTLKYYETPTGNWGVSMPSLWLVDEQEFDKAKDLLANYQQQRYITAREEYNQLKERGEHDTLIKRLFREPLAVLFYAIAIFSVIYLTLYPFL